MKKPSKRQMIQTLVNNNVSVSRSDRKDEHRLIDLLIENGLQTPDESTQDIDHQVVTKEPENVPRGTIETPDTSHTDIEDEEEQMFARMSNTVIEDEPFQTVNISDDVTEVTVKNKRKKRTVNGQTSKQPEFSTFQVEGYMLLLVVDLCIPTGIVLIYNMFTKDKSKKIETSDIALKEDQKASIMPLADAAARSLSLNMNPLTAFGLMYCLSCGANLMMVKEVKDAKAKN